MENQLHTQASLQLLPLGYAPYPLASDSPLHQVIPCGYIQAAHYSGLCWPLKDFQELLILSNRNGICPKYTLSPTGVCLEVLLGCSTVCGCAGVIGSRV